MVTTLEGEKIKILVRREEAELEDSIDNQIDLTGPNNGRWEIDPTLFDERFNSLKPCTKIQLTRLEPLASGILLSRILSNKGKVLNSYTMRYLMNWYGFKFDPVKGGVYISKCGITLNLFNSSNKIELKLEYKEMQKYLINLLIKWVDYLQE